MRPKHECKFCGRTNTKIVTRYESTGLFSSRPIGKEEVIDENAPAFYRCTRCGEVYCQTCLSNMRSIKGILFSHYVCPNGKCGAKVCLI